MSNATSSRMRAWRWMLALALALAGASTIGAGAPARTQTADAPANADPGYVHYAIGDQAARATRPVEPGLLLNGGGAWPRDAFRWFAARAGHGHVVVLRASLAAEVQEELFRDVGGIASAETFVFHDRRAARDPVVLAAIARADGVFIAGGDQARYVRFWKGTPLNAALDRHVRAGKPIGGTSAGLAILGGWAYGALEGGSLTSDVALADPQGRAVTLVDDFLHIDLLRNVITDTHFSERKRLGRLIAMLAQLRSRGVDDVVGLGIDESASLCVDGDGRGRLFTRGEAGRPDTGEAWLVETGPSALRAEAGRGLVADGLRITGIGVDSRFHLRDLRVERPAFRRIADVRDGRVTLRDAESVRSHAQPSPPHAAKPVPAPEIP